MTNGLFTQADLDQMKQLGITEEEARRQMAILEKGPRLVSLQRPFRAVCLLCGRKQLPKAVLAFFCRPPVQPLGCLPFCNASEAERTG